MPHLHLIAASLERSGAVGVVNSSELWDEERRTKNKKQKPNKKSALARRRAR
jgi:hypothetical protein